MKKFACSLFFILVSQPSIAGNFLDGNNVYNLCFQGGLTQYEAYFFVAGVLDSIEFHQSIGGPKLVCVPAGVTITQAGQVFCKYLVDHPESRHYNAASLIAGAFYSTYPCPNSK